MLEIRIHGRGGQGAQVGCQILASAFFKAGRWVQAFAAYGGERRGAPVTAFLRVDDRPIRLRSDIERPHHIVVLDPTLLADPNVTANLRKGGKLFVNAPSAAVLPEHLPAVVTTDATAIALRYGLGAVVATAMLGAFAGATELLPLERLVAAVRAGSPARTEENVAACTEAYQVCASAQQASGGLRAVPLVFVPSRPGESGKGGGARVFEHIPDRSHDPGSARPLVWSEPGRTTRQILTGGWRTHRPQYVERPAPCHLACPAGAPIPAWIARAATGDYRRAWELLRQENPLPAVTGRVCSHPCEVACNRSAYDGAVTINALERFIGDWGLCYGQAEVPPLQREEQVAVVGGGPAGLACAYHLARLGYRVTVYEAMPELGGLLRYGIPAYRLPRQVLNREIELILGLGITVHTEARLGRTVPWEALDGYQAVFLATGAPCPVRLGMAGEASQGVYDGLAFLREVNAGERPPLGERVVVVGGGSTAMDVARTARRFGATVTVVALEAREAMPAVADEVAQALDEGITVLYQMGVEELLVCEGRVAGVRVRPARPSVTAAGAIQPVFCEGSATVLPADALLLALGQLPDATLLPPGLQLHRGLFAGGDMVPGPRSVAHAVGSGTRAARALHRLLRGQPCTRAFSPIVPFAAINLDHFPRLARAERGQRAVAERVTSFLEVVRGLEEAEAYAQARRCFSCGACTGCDLCLMCCPDMAIRRLDASGYEVLTDYCKGCGLCARECPRGALVMVAER